MIHGITELVDSKLNQLNWFVIMEQTFQTWIAAKSLMESKL